MKILMITEKDAANQSLARIAKAYTERRHEVTIYAPYYEKNVLRWFDKSIAIAPYDELDDRVIAACDFIFASTVAAAFLFEKNILFTAKPIFTHNYLINRQISLGGDFCFVPSIATVTSEYDRYLQYSYIEIGEPKYDSVTADVSEKNMLLFIDSGHYPFGEQGKRELARTLIEIANACPDYELWIKPRFLPGDTVITHQNTLHLYEIIRREAEDELPSNLILLQEHRDLKELIDLCHTVICMHTTAFVGAYAADKGLIVLDGLPNEDVYDLRWKVINTIREEILPSGAVIPYQDVKAFLPDGIKCSQQYKQYLLAEQENTAEKICETTEYLFQEFYQKGRFPKETDTSYANFKTDITAQETGSWEQVIRRRCEDFFLQRMLILIDYNVKSKLDIQFLADEIRNLPTNYDAFKKEVTEKIRNAAILRDLCIVKNSTRLLADDIDAGILLNALYRTGHAAEIKTFPRQDIGAFYLFRGFVADDEGDTQEAVACLKQYADISLGRKYIKEVSDMPGNRTRAFRILLNNLADKGDEKLTDYLHEFERAYLMLYGETPITSSIQGQQYTQLYWMKQRIDRGNQDLQKEIQGQHLIIYGAGAITREVLLQIPEIRSQTVALIDNYLQEDEIAGIPVLRHEAMYAARADLCIIAIPHLEQQIKTQIAEHAHIYRVVGVNELF